jgi:outer membrane protein assembly factor BamD
MFNIRINTVCFVLLAACITLSCSQYEKALKSEDVDYKYQRAFYYYNKGVYVKASTLFDQLAPLTRGTRKADSVFFYQAMTQYNLNDYIIAGHYFSNFVTMYENSSFIEEATFMEAYCYYLQSPRPELDQSSTMQAMNAFQLFLIRYPASSRSEQCKNIILELREKLMEKEYISAQLYFNIENYSAAITALNTCLLDYPDSRFREEIMLLLLRSKYLLAVNSISSKQTQRYQDTVDEYLSFKTEFPASKNIKDADVIYENASKFIQEKETTNN